MSVATETPPAAASAAERMVDALLARGALKAQDLARATDGGATILMPHPDRTLRMANFSWVPAEWVRTRLGCGGFATVAHSDRRGEGRDGPAVARGPAETAPTFAAGRLCLPRMRSRLPVNDGDSLPGFTG